MNDERSRFADAARLLGRAAANEFEAHPKVEDLAALAAGLLAPEAEDEIQEHLTWCTSCAELVRDYRLLAEGPAEPLPPADLDAAWQRFNAPEGGASEPPRAPVPTPSPRSRVPWRFVSPGFAYAVAASALLAAGLGWVSSLHKDRRLAEALAPRANVPRYTLYPEGAARGSGPAAVPLGRVRQGAMLVLHPAIEFEPGSYVLRLLDQRGALAWQSGALAPTDAGTFTLDLAGGSLPLGRYRLELRRVGSAELVASYPLELISGGP